MKRTISLIMMLCVILAMLAGCHKDTTTETEDQAKAMTFYYLNEEENGLMKLEKPLDLPTETEAAIQVILDEIASSQEEEGFIYRSVVNEQVKINEFILHENGEATIDFDAAYHQLTQHREVLVRAAIVKTLTQLDQVEWVSFTIEGEPLAQKAQNDGSLVGVMTDETFVMDNDKKEVYDYTENVKLYLANEAGDQLISVKTKMDVQDNQSIELAVLEALKTTHDDKKGIKSPLPPDLTFNHVTIIQNICYVDLSEEIMKAINGVEEKVKIYAMVNSLTSLSRISQVQFTVGGKVLTELNEIENFDRPFDCDYAFTIENEATEYMEENTEFE